LGRIKLKQAFANAKACGLQKEVKATLNATCAHVGKRVGHEVGQCQYQAHDGQYLVNQSTKRLGAPKTIRRFGGGGVLMGVNRPAQGGPDIFVKDLKN
jgi:hypothetical protein